MIFRQNTTVKKDSYITEVVVSRFKVPEESVRLSTNVGEEEVTLVAMSALAVVNYGDIVKLMKCISTFFQEQENIVGFVAQRNHDIDSRRVLAHKIFGDGSWTAKGEKQANDKERQDYTAIHRFTWLTCERERKFKPIRSGFICRHMHEAVVTCSNCPVSHDSQEHE